jgi:hypothetical protein
VAFFDGFVYSGPEWSPQTAAPAMTTVRWIRPAATNEGLLELLDRPEGEAGPWGIRYHTAVDTSLPNAPQNLRVLYGDREVQLTWDPPEEIDARAREHRPAAAPPESYVVRAGTGPGESNLANYDTGSLATTLLTSAPAGVYFVRVYARAASGLGPPSNEVSFSLDPAGCNGPPGVSGTLSGAGGDLSARIAWGQAVAATSYIVEAGSAPLLSNSRGSSWGARRAGKDRPRQVCTTSACAE